MGQYFEQQPAAESDPDVVELTVGDIRLSLTTDAGVFSRHRLDRGTEVLLRKAPPPPTEGVLLDLGCGYGPIACALAVQSPHSWVWAVDVNERARDLAARNAAALGLSNVTVVGPDEMPDDVQFDVIYSNPPVRIGKDAMFELLTHWLDRLVPHEENPLERAERAGGGGRAFLVVQKHLGADSLQTRLQRDGYLTERLASSKGYRVLVCAGRVTATFSDDPTTRYNALGPLLPPAGSQDL